MPTDTNELDKEQFIKTCDAMLHARLIGETFGLAVAEFSVHNKPVLTFPGSSQEHILMLGEKGFVYHNKQELLAMVESIIEAGGFDTTQDYNAYRDYGPEKVMAQFKKIFLDPTFKTTE